jgi:glycosyltransferase involved in cell wall biosynthesis
MENGVNTKPVVSIIISFLNAQRFLSEAIDSVCGQTFRDWELLLVDDGSVDSSTALAMGLACEMPNKVRYLEHEHHLNRGQAASRNLGLRLATGRYIAILDSDDVWHPDKLAEQVQLLESHSEAALVYGHTEYWHSWTSRDGDRKRNRIPNLGVELDRIYTPPTLLRLCLCGKALMPCPSDLIFRRDPVLALGGFQEEFTGMYGMYEDQAFLVTIFLNLPVLVVNKCWDRYRQHAESMCAVQTQSGQEPLIRFFYFRWLERYLSANGVQDGLIWKSVRRSMWPLRHPRLTRMLGPSVRVARQVHARYLDLWRGQPR